MGRVGDRHALPAPLGLHRRDVEDEIRAADALPGVRVGLGRAAVLKRK